MGYCRWCGRYYEFGYGFFSGYCSKKCSVDAEAHESQQSEYAAQRQQEKLDSMARQKGYADYEEYKQAQNQALEDSVDEEADELLDKSYAVLSRYESLKTENPEEAFDVNNKRRLADILSKYQGSNFAEEEFSPLYIEDGTFYHFSPGLTSEEAENLFKAYSPLVTLKKDRKKITKKNKSIKVSREVEYYTGAYITTKSILEFLIENPEGIEDILNPLLEKAERNSIAKGNINTIVTSCIAIATAFISTFIQVGVPVSNSGASFWGAAFSFAALCLCAFSSGFRRKKVAGLIVTFILPIAMYILQGIMNQTEHAYSTLMLKMAFFTSLFTIFPAILSLRKKKYFSSMQLKEADLDENIKDNDKTGNNTVFFCLVSIVLLFVANYMSIGLDTGFESPDDEMGYLFWSAVFTIAAGFAPIYSIQYSKISIHSRPSKNIMLLILAIFFIRGSFSYFGRSHIITGILTFAVGAVSLGSFILNLLNQRKQKTQKKSV